MSHPLIKSTNLHRVLNRSRKTTSVNSTLPVDSRKRCMQLTNNNSKDTYMSAFLFCQHKIQLFN